MICKGFPCPASDKAVEVEKAAVAVKASQRTKPKTHVEPARDHHRTAKDLSVLKPECCHLATEKFRMRGAVCGAQKFEAKSKAGEMPRPFFQLI